MMMTPGEQPNAKDVPPDEKHAILYARMSSVNTIDEAERIFALLSNGGEIFMPMQEIFFAFRVAMLRDKFGTSWMIINECAPRLSA